MTAAAPSGPVRRRTLHAQFVRRLLWPLVTAFVLAASVTALVGYHAEKSEQDTQRAQTLAIFARSLIKPLWDCDGATAQGIADTLAQLPIVRGVRLQDVCADTAVETGSVAAPDAADPDLLQTPVVHRDEQGRAFTVGHLAIQFHPFSVASTASQGLLQQLAIFGAMLAVVLAGAALVFRSIIGRPLARFREAILAHRPVHEDAPAPARFADELTDVTHAYDELVRELRRLARHDPLTDLGNRVVLEEHLASAIERAVTHGGHGYVLLLDLDGFKPINDTHGHAVGDFVLQTVARRLRAATRGTDMVARLGGDEFVIVAEGPQPGLSDLMVRVARAVEEPIASGAGLLRVGTSIGAARFPDDGRTSLALLMHADEAMYAAKQGKRRAPKA
ncbi:GGDEF domain-containing protein [Acidovorax sp. MR-S7]|uniref:GGDEF domain-containing protein n=1 Tax=Acidovorax sp. MR-S7 TaxID=1268622 RepID=UPI00036150C8|nr:GGDEF domain-containing protein [Acidovorax sp. MR-S7]GAD21442.1 FOG: GGDEF domain [Acidovorax sp. MR-S7]